jgi:rhamnosyltransferase
MALPTASIVVRVQDGRSDLDELLPLVRAQTVAAELIVVDSGSRDGSQDVARRFADQIIELEPGTYSPGRALNRGAAASEGEIIFALSSHCRPRDDRWIEGALELYAREDVAATNGSPAGPDGERFHGVFYQAADHARAHPHWGFSNHASSWRAEVWSQHPFDEEVVTAEDRLWAIDVTAAGWLIAFDARLWIEQEHRWKNGTLNWFRRERHELLVIGANHALPAYPASALIRDWWRAPDDHHARAFHRFVNYRRWLALTGRYLGHRDARRIRR